MGQIDIITEVPDNYYSVEVGVDEDGSVIRRKKGCEKELVSTPSCGARTLYELWNYAATNFPNNKCLGKRSVIEVVEETKVLKNKKKIILFPKLSPFSWETYSEIDRRLYNFSNGLIHLGMKPGDLLCIFLETSIEWTISCHSCYLKNIVIVTSYENLGKDALVYALNNAKIELLICNSTSIPLVSEIESLVPSLKTVIYTNQEAATKTPNNSMLKFIPFSEVESMGVDNASANTPPTPEDLACIMYTSGSTGTPKGVLVTHGNLVAAVAGMELEISITPDDSYLSYLPLAHIMAFVVENVLLAHGASIGYGSPRTLTQNTVKDCKGDIAELSPTLFIAVPTIYERIQKGVMDRIKSSNIIVQYLFDRGFKSQLSAIRSGSSSAPLSGIIQDFVRVCISVPVLQGYGLTETTSCGCIQSMNAFDLGTIGAPFSCLEMKLLDVPEMGYTTKSQPYPAGEICIRGPILSKGYYNDPVKTAESFKNSWFRTGDVGVWLPSGQVAIVDRIKNLIKPPHGEYISIEKLESIYRISPLVESILVHADSYHFYCVALVVPVKDVLMKECLKHKFSKNFSWEEACQSQFVEELVLEKLKATGLEQNLKSIELIRAVKLLPEPWTPQNSFLTAAMKINRTYIENTMKDSIEQMYDDLN